MFGRITLFLISLIALCGVSSQCKAQCPEEPVALEDFTGSVSVKPQLRFEITSIKAGNAPVDHLFSDLNQVKTNWWKGGFFRRVDRPLVLKSPAARDELHDTLIREKANILKVTLEDHHLASWRGVPGFRSGIYEYECDIKVSLPDCEQRTQLIYDKVLKFTQELRMKRETTDHLELGEAFNKLLIDNLEDYMKDLPLPKYGPCVNEIELKKYVSGDGTAGFRTREYLLDDGQKSFLDVMALIMQDEAKYWSQYHLDVKIVGYADSDVVSKPINLLTGEGLDEVYYDGCDGDQLKGKARYLDFFSHGQGKLIKNSVDNNCKLGAVRAYVATAYLIKKLGTDYISYSYATGGSRGKAGQVNDADRRIDTEFIMKGARKGNNVSPSD